jgi:hypothetical protein
MQVIDKTNKTPRKTDVKRIEPNKTNTPSPSFYDLTKDLCGSISAPPDLSANKQYLKGYGK